MNQGWEVKGISNKEKKLLMSSPLSSASMDGRHHFPFLPPTNLGQALGAIMRKKNPWDTFTDVSLSLLP